MSILGVKKKHIDTSKMEKEILKMKSEIITINRKDRYLYNNANTLNLKILNIENKVNNIKDRKIICIYAGIEGSLDKSQYFNFNAGGPYYPMNFPGEIIGISLVSMRSLPIKQNEVSVIIVHNNRYLIMLNW